MMEIDVLAWKADFGGACPDVGNPSQAKLAYKECCIKHTSLCMATTGGFDTDGDVDETS